MANFIRKCGKNLKITQAWDLCQLFEDPSYTTDETKPIYAFLSEFIQLNKVGSNIALKAIDEGFNRSLMQKEKLAD